MIQLTALGEKLGACRKEARQALQRHVFKRSGGAMPKLHDVGFFVKGGDRTNVFAIELRAVRFIHELVNRVVGHVNAKALVHFGCTLRIRLFRQGDNLIDGHGGHVLGNEQSAAIGESFYNGFSEGDRVGAASARIDVEVFSHSLSSLREWLQTFMHVKDVTSTVYP